MVAGQTAALALKKVKRAGVRKGMVLADERLHPKASWEFDADIAILTHSTTIQPRYQVRRNATRCNLCTIARLCTVLHPLSLSLSLSSPCLICIPCEDRLSRPTCQDPKGHGTCI